MTIQHCRPTTSLNTNSSFRIYLFFLTVSGFVGSLHRCTTSCPTAKSVRAPGYPRNLLHMWRVRTVVLKLTTAAPQLNPNKGVRPLRQPSSQESFCSLRTGVSQITYRHMSSEPKRLCIENMTGIKIGTHNGTFHCDEVLACFFLRQLPEYKVCSATLFDSHLLQELLRFRSKSWLMST